MKTALALCASTLLFFSAPASAGPYGDELSKCLVSSTSEADRNVLIKWFFAAISLNTEVAPFVDMSHEVRSTLNKDTAGIYMRLLTETCRTQTHEAFRYEGQAAIQSAFQLLGQVAAQGMFSDPVVAAGLTDLMQHFDEDRLDSVLKGE